MTEDSAPYVPESEPTEAPLCRMFLEKLRYHHSANIGMVPSLTEINGFAACMKAARWDTGDEG